MSAFSRIIVVEIHTTTKIISIDKFKMDFSIKKTESKDANTCTLNIYNLSEQTRNQITNKDSVLILKAGYVEGFGPEVIFVGDITEAAHLPSRPYVITTIEAKDGQKALTNKKISFSYKEGISIKTLIENAVSALGLPLKTKEGLSSIKNKIFNGGYQFTGTVKKLLDDLTGEHNELWSIQNGEVKIYDVDSDDNSFAIVINQDTGMVDSPKQIKIKRGKKKTDYAGWEITSLLHPKAEPGGLIKLTSLAVPEETQFKIINVEHVSDNVKDKSITTLQVI